MPLLYLAMENNVNTAECTASGVAGNFTCQVNNLFSCDFIELQLLYEII